MATAAKSSNGAAAAAAAEVEIGGKRKHDSVDAVDKEGGKRSKAETKYPKIRVINWNILASEYTRYNLDGKNNETVAQRNGRWIHQIKFLQKHADIATLQEITKDFLTYAFAGTIKASDEANDEFKTLAGALDEMFEYWFVKREYLKGAVLAADQKPKNDGCAVLLRKGMFAPIKRSNEQKGKFFSDAGGGNFSPKASVSLLDPRCCVIVHVRTLDGKEVATIASVHLEGKQDTDGKRVYTDIRTAQLSETRAMMWATAGTVTPRLMVVAGDFNQEWNYYQIKDAFGDHMYGMDVDVTNRSKERPNNIPGCTGVPDFEFEASGLDPPQTEGYAVIEPADTFTSVFGAIDQVLTKSSVENTQPGIGPFKSLASRRMVVLPEPKDRVKTSDGKLVTGRGGAKPSPYLCSPYEDGGKWSSDHWAMFFKLLLPS